MTTSTSTTPAGLARDAGEAIRQIAHATRTAGGPGWEQASDAYDTVGELALLAGPLQQFIEQLDRAIERAAAAGTLNQDADALAPLGPLRTAKSALSMAAQRAWQLGYELDSAHNALAAIGGYLAPQD